MRRHGYGVSIWVALLFLASACGSERAGGESESDSQRRSRPSGQDIAEAGLDGGAEAGDAAPAEPRRESLASPRADVAASTNEPLRQRTYAVQVIDAMIVRGGSLGVTLESHQNPAEPDEQGRLVLPGSINGLAHVRSGLVAAGAGAAGIYLVDIATATEPAQVGHMETDGAVWRLERDGQRVLIADGHAGVLIADLRQPENPRVLGRWASEGYVRHVLPLAEGRAAVAEGRAGVALLDLSTPARPRLLARVDTEGEARSLTRRGDQLFVADFHDGVAAIDISDLEHPRELGRAATRDSARDVAVFGEHLVVAVGTYGFQVFDASDAEELSSLQVVETRMPAVRFAKREDQLIVVVDSAGVEVWNMSDPTNPARIFPAAE